MGEDGMITINCLNTGDKLRIFNNKRYWAS